MTLDFFKELMQPLKDKATSLGYTCTMARSLQKNQCAIDDYDFVMFGPEFCSVSYHIENGVFKFFSMNGEDPYFYLSDPKCIEKMIDTLDELNK